MASLFDSLVDLTLGLVAPVAPATPPMFAADPAATLIPVELEVAAPRPQRAHASGLPGAPAGTQIVEHVHHVSSVVRGADPGPSAPPAAYLDVPILAAPLAPTIERVTVSHHEVSERERVTARAPSFELQPTQYTATASPTGGETTTILVPASVAAPPDVMQPRSAARAAMPEASRPEPARRSDAAQQPRAAGGDHVVKVTIGRVDVRAIHPREPAPRPSPAAPRTTATLSDYLRDRAKGGR